MRCRRCDSPATFTPTRAKEFSRFRRIAAFAAVLSLLALLLWLLEVEAWPWWIAAAAFFVLSQALLKWHASRWVMCSSGKHAYTHYGFARER